MKIAIIAAMSKEIELLRKAMNNLSEHSIGGQKILKGDIGGHEVIVAQCGIGKVNSAINTYRLIEAEHPELVINSGVAGSGDESMNVGDMLFATEVAYHDAWCGPGTEYGAADGFAVRMPVDKMALTKAESLFGDTLKYGLICSGDKFMTTAEELEFVKSKFADALAVDMESTSIGQVCMMNNVPFAILRAISDRPGSGDNISEYKNFWVDTPTHLAQTVQHLIKNL